MLRLTINETINNKINILRDKLNKQIEKNEDYEAILNTSMELDILISEYYSSTQDNT